MVNVVSAAFSTVCKAFATMPMNWAQYGNNTSCGSLTKSLILVVLSAIQLSVTVFVARSIIFFRLLTSGDVEQNPGPDQTECMYFNKRLGPLITVHIKFNTV